MPLPNDQPKTPMPNATDGLPQPAETPMAASSEMEAYLRRLESEKKTVGRRNQYLAVALAVGIVAMLAILWGIHRATIGAHAVIDGVEITQSESNPGRIHLSFHVTSPGKVFYRRTSGGVETDLIDTFHSTGSVERSWSWVYDPGKEIDVTLWYRRGLWRQTTTARFPTTNRADFVILIDTTSSMDPSIDVLKEKCQAFSEQLGGQSLEARFALIGFGDSGEDDWIDRYPFTDDVHTFRRSVEQMQRYDGGDLPESALDALEEALQLPFEEEAIRRCYLVTDASYHEPTRSGLKVDDLVKRLQKKHVALRVFSRRAFEKDYQRLLGETGRFLEIENFGHILSEGRVLED